MDKSLTYKSTAIQFNDPKYSDVKFVFKKEATTKTIYSHRTVLLIECPVLLRLAYGTECVFGNIVTINPKNVPAGLCGIWIL